MRVRVKTAEHEGKPLGDLLEIIRFTEVVSAKLHRVLDEAKIYQLVMEEFVKSKRWTASIVLLADDGASLELAEASVTPSQLKVLEKASGLRAEGFKIDLRKSSIYSQVVREGKTVQATVSDIISEFLSPPLAYLISKTMGYEKKHSILTPLRRQGKVIGVFAMSSTDLSEDFIPSVENLALHISTALELAHEHAQRNQAVQALRKYHDHLKELVEERTAELETVNEKLRREITERKQVEEETNRIRERLQLQVERMPVGLIVWDTDFRVLSWNPAAENIFGFTAEEALGKHPYDIIVPKEAQPHVDTIWSRLLAGDMTAYSTNENITKDGRTIVCDWANTPLREKGGAVVGALSMVQDITERRQAEEELKLRAQVLDGATDSIFLHDFDGNFIYVNETACRTHDYSREELMKMKLNQVVAPERVGRLDSDFQEMVEKGELIFESAHLRKGGSIMPAEIHGRTIESGGRKLLLTVIRDITERKQVEQALQAEKNKLQSLIDAMEYGLTIQDKDYNIIYQNEPQRVIFGDHLGEKCYRVYEGRDKVCDECSVEEAFRDGKSHTSERRVVLPSGEVTFGENTANPVRDASGKIVSCLEITRNITERKRMEEELKESQEFTSSLLENAPNPIEVINPDTSIRYMNPAFEKLTGFTLAEIVGMKPPYPWWPEESKKEITAALKEDMTGESRRRERISQKKNGERFWAVLSTAPVMHDGTLRYFVLNWLDITERKQAEEALRGSEQRYRALFESTLDGVFVIDAGTMKVVLANKAAANLFGFDSAEDVSGMSPLDFVPPDGRDRVIQIIAEDMFAKDLRQVNEFRAITQDGREIWIRAVGVRTEYQGRLAGLVSFSDITERKQAEEALRGSREQLRKMFESVTDGISVIDLNGIITEANQRTVEMHGFASKDELLGKSAFELVAPRDHERIAANMRKALKQGIVRGVEYTLLKADGTEFPGELSTSVLRDASGKPVGHITIARDITERKRMEEALERQKAYFQQLFDNSPDAIAWVDTADRFVSVNKGFETLFGYRPEEIEGRFINDTIIPEDRIGEASALSRARFSNKMVRKEAARKRKDGSLVDVSIIGYPIRFGNKAVGAYVIYTDITERKRAEEKEKQLQQELYLAQRLASVGELAAGVAHEINNPLTGVLGFSQRLLRKSTSEELSHDLEIIHGEAKRAAEVVQNLLTFARRREPKKEYSNINDIVQKALELRGYALQTGNVEVMTDLAPSLPEIMLDFHQIQEVFLNLLLNAEQAMNEAHGGGKLIIKTREVKGYVRISFADDGPGIPPEQLDKVFDPFFTTRAERGGTGLGLSACHGIVTEHGGRIYARGKPGKGATFFVELPLSPIETTVVRRF